jgi:hypothetical protein
MRASGSRPHCDGLRSRRRILRSMISKWALLAALVVLATACSSHSETISHRRAVLYQGVGLRHPGTTTVASRRLSDAATRQGGARIRKQWEREIRSRALAAPRQHFANLSPNTLRRRLAAAANDHDFQVVTVKLLRPKQLAPEIAVRTTHYVALAHALPSILRSLDPHRGRLDNRGWSYEGFYFEAQDERGVPFLAVYNFWRGEHKGGGQWARSEPLFPFQHG